MENLNPDIGSEQLRGKRIDAKSLEYKCGYCGARPGQKCSTKTGRRAGHIHGDRWYRARRYVFTAEGVS